MTIVPIGAGMSGMIPWRIAHHLGPEFLAGVPIMYGLYYWPSIQGRGE
jgi:hypothetical protein